MNALTRTSLYGIAFSAVCIGLGLLDKATGIVSMAAPTEAHAFGWLCIIAVCTIIARSYAHGGVRLPSLRDAAMPRPRAKYAKRVRRYV